MTGSFMEMERARATRWKRSTSTLPDDAREPAPYVGKDGVTGSTTYDFCLPPEHAALTLLPEVRDTALRVFSELGIPWHAGVDGGPSNHLLSSQVQCVNALTPMIEDPGRIAAAFGSVVELGEVLEIEPGRFLTFEYIGGTDFFGESVDGSRTRGAKCTSVDAAFLHRAPDGVVELVLVEWKYTERYRKRRPDGRKDGIRAERYKRFVDDPSGPVRSDVLPFDLLLDEPFYQLVRQQLLAHQLERSGAEGAGRVRVVHVLPAGNDGYQGSLTRPEQRSLGESVSEVWRQLLRATDRFASLDSAVFHDPAVTSREYALRYGVYAAHDHQGLLDAMGIDDESGVEDRLYTDVEFDGDVQLREDGVELIVDRVGTLLEYPFLIDELFDLAQQVEVEAEQNPSEA